VTIRDVVEQYARVVTNNPSVVDDEIEAALVSAGCSRVDTHMVIQLAPIAFGRLILDGLGCKIHPELIFFDTNGEVISRTRCVDDPVYVEVAQLAAARPDLARAVATKSSELRAVSNALDAGSQVSDLVLSPPIAFRGVPSPAGVAHAQRVMNTALLAQVVAVEPESAARRSWWRLWRRK
jgi:hypothetical protein